ncbi:MAG: Asp-tRNA(Asn)/Glu-tRNA(Gln) amidotransferase subunit GatC [Candidatus Paceibacteria bacterium]
MTVSKDDVKKLATLSRIGLSEQEIERMQGEFDSILAYIETIQKVALPEGVAPSPHLPLENVMREDGEPHAPNEYTEAMFAQAPERDGRFLKVKKILGG